MRPRAASDERRATSSPATNVLVWKSTDTATARPTRSGTSQDASDKDFTLTGSRRVCVAFTIQNLCVFPGAV